MSVVSQGPADHIDTAVVVDGQHVPVSPQDSPILLDFLRAHGFRAPKRACGRGECGSCSVLVGDDAVMACCTFVALVDGPVTTAAGLGEDGDQIRESFADHAGLQCGYCTPGQIVRAAAVLRHAAGELSRTEVARHMVGNVCRCTGYVQIVDSVLAASQRRQARLGATTDAAVDQGPARP